ncbi:MAG TPA: class I SAM-dependent methyltransferase [Rhizomicrobium sp.]
MPPETSETYDPRRFQTTVPYYARYRLGYPPLLIRRVVERTRLNAGDVVLDLGCGPGLLAVPFAQAGMKVLGVDPEPDMLAAAKEEAKAADVHVELRQGSSFDLPAGIGPFNLVTMGRSFHWMDREATLKILDGLIAPGGAIALFDDVHSPTVENRWRFTVHEVGNKYGRAQEPHIQARAALETRRHDSILLDTAFRHLETVGVVIKREITADDVVGLAFSLSTSAPQKLGDRIGAFETDLRAELAKLSPDGRFTEIAEMRALIARRE